MKKNAFIKKYDRKGFTLIEVIVVLLTIAIISAIAVPALTGYIDDAKNRAAATEGRNLMNALTSTTVGVYGLGNITNGSQEGLLDWDGGSTKDYHEKNGTKTTSPTIGYSMVANPNTKGVLTDRARKQVAKYMNTDEKTIIESLYCLIVEYNTTYGGKSDTVAGFVYTKDDKTWIAYNSKDDSYKAFSSVGEAFTYAKKCSPYF